MIGTKDRLIRNDKNLLIRAERPISISNHVDTILDRDGRLKPPFDPMDDIGGISYIKDELINGSNRDGDSIMEAPLPPWGVVVLEGPSVGDARSAYFKARSHGAVMYRIPFDTFNPKGTPESKARFGVQIVQIASLLKNFSIASLRPKSYGGMVPEKILPESYRLNFLKTIASQGFAWIEIEQSIRNDMMRDIVSYARRSGSKIMLTCRLEDMIEWKPPADIDQNLFDGYRIIVPINNGKDLRRLIRASINARKWVGAKTLVVEPLDMKFKLPWVINSLSLSDMVDIRLDELTTPASDVLRDRGSIWSTLGITGAGMSKEWSMNNRSITPESKVFLQMGKTRGNSYRTWIFNSQFNDLRLDGLMIPWECDNSSVKECLDMARRMDIKGAMVEMPLRSNVVRKMDWVDPRSASVGSIDVISIKNGLTHGYNSEIYGISDMIKTLGLDKGAKVLILGTGASGRSAAVASSILGHLTFLAGNSKERTQEITEVLEGDIRPTTFKILRKISTKFDLIINSVPFETRTVKGMANQTMEIADLVKGLKPVYGMDLYERIAWTPFLASVESSGGKTITGSEVLVRTSLRAFKLLTGTEGSGNCIQRVLEDVHS